MTSGNNNHDEVLTGNEILGFGRNPENRKNIIDSQSSAMLSQTSWSNWKTIEAPNAGPGAPEKMAIYTACLTFFMLELCESSLKEKFRFGDGQSF